MTEAESISPVAAAQNSLTGASRPGAKQPKARGQERTSQTPASSKSVTAAGALGMLPRVHRRSLAWALCLLAAPAVTGCTSGTETGNPSFQAELSYAAYSSAPLAIGVRMAGSQAEVDSAWLDLDGVALLAAGSCAGGAPQRFSIPALGIGDHAAGKHNVTRFELGTGSYCGLELPFVRVAPGQAQGDVPPSLEQHSMMIAGVLADGTPFSILSSATPIVRLTADTDSFEISADRAATLLTFDLSTWLSELDFQSATRSAGAIVISSTENASLLAQFESRLSRGVALYRDTDGDGKLDDNAERLAHSQ